MSVCGPHKTTRMQIVRIEFENYIFSPLQLPPCPKFYHSSARGSRDKKKKKKYRGALCSLLKGAKINDSLDPPPRWETSWISPYNDPTKIKLKKWCRFGSNFGNIGCIWQHNWIAFVKFKFKVKGHLICILMSGLLGFWKHFASSCTSYFCRTK